MDLITKSPGLKHIAEAILSNLTKENEFTNCQKVNTFWKSILNTPTFWLKKCSEKGLSNQYYLEWSKLIQQPKNQHVDEDVILHLQKMFFTKTFLPPIQMSFIDMMQCLGQKIYNDKLDIMKIMAPISENANASFPHSDYFGYNFDEYTPIQIAVDMFWDHMTSKECIEIIKILAPFSDNPDAPDPTGWTPIQKIIFVSCHIRSEEMIQSQREELIKILAPLSKYLDYVSPNGWTALQFLAEKGNLEIIKILAPLSSNPNAPKWTGWTPIHYAAVKGHLEIIKILAPLSDNPNSPDDNGMTPIYKAVEMGYLEVIKILAPLSDNPNAPDNNGITPTNLATCCDRCKKLLSFSFTN